MVPVQRRLAASCVIVLSGAISACSGAPNVATTIPVVGEALRPALRPLSRIFT
jgi:hypothetical protein